MVARADTMRVELMWGAPMRQLCGALVRVVACGAYSGQIQSDLAPGSGGGLSGPLRGGGPQRRALAGQWSFGPWWLGAASCAWRQGVGDAGKL